MVFRPRRLGLALKTEPVDTVPARPRLARPRPGARASVLRARPRTPSVLWLRPRVRPVGLGLALRTEPPRCTPSVLSSRPKDSLGPTLKTEAPNRVLGPTTKTEGNPRSWHEDRGCGSEASVLTAGPRGGCVQRTVRRRGETARGPSRAGLGERRRVSHLVAVSRGRGLDVVRYRFAETISALGAGRGP